MAFGGPQSPFRRASRLLLSAVLLMILLVLLFWWFAQLNDNTGPPRVLKRATPEEAAIIKDEIAIVILTSSPTLEARMGNLLNSWVPNWRDNTYWFSDGDLPKETSLPTRYHTRYVNTGCSNTYQDGLLCKNRVMMLLFQQEPYKHYKWVMRLMDDTWLHVENLWHLTRQYNSSERIVIGEKYCHPKFPYPTGGPGFVISRGLIDSFDTDNWRKLSEMHTKDTVFDDLAWGQQIKAMKAKLIHHNGFSQFPASIGNPIYNYMQHRFTWDLPFRPVAYHQGPSKFDLMTELEDVLHRLPYDNLETKLPLPNPECKCYKRSVNAHEVRCTPRPDQSITHRQGCGGDFDNINCLTGL